MFSFLKSLITHPLVRSLDIDTPEATLRRSHIIPGKPFLQLLYKQWYEEISSSLPGADGAVLELGSGAGFLKKYIPDLITSEILEVLNVDLILDGQFLSFKKNSLMSIVMIDVFHHIPDVKSFLHDAEYCLKPGGKIIMIEPWCTVWSKLIYKYLHHEPFEPDVKGWSFPESGPLSGANGALPWIVFERDLELFKKCFPCIAIQKIRIHTPFSYIFSGGISFRFSLPGSLFKSFSTFEKKIKSLSNSWGMFATIVLKKK
ncbi:SAM-dependent methyltransferase [Desulfonema limicola]|uniref:SAM-dependent methyltransferase n=1 Tax=Desulfonema limicola TaxID=45656 RepID=A0A975BAC8_9BACT|nr:methyltransferase domain-containing protein [Desulfonema limicola]QTA81916.1 SAM-dependent methyltransferase [Desulfonema limicola]